MGHGMAQGYSNLRGGLGAAERHVELVADLNRALAPHLPCHDAFRRPVYAQYTPSALSLFQYSTST